MILESVTLVMVILSGLLAAFGAFQGARPWKLAGTNGIFHAISGFGFERVALTILARFAIVPVLYMALSEPSFAFWTVAPLLVAACSCCFPTLAFEVGFEPRLPTFRFSPATDTNRRTIVALVFAAVTGAFVFLKSFNRFGQFADCAGSMCLHAALRLKEKTQVRVGGRHG